MTVCVCGGPLTKDQLDALLAAADEAVATARRLREEIQRQREIHRKAAEQRDTEREHLRERGTKPSTGTYGLEIVLVETALKARARAKTRMRTAAKKG